MVGIVGVIVAWDYGWITIASSPAPQQSQASPAPTPEEVAGQNDHDNIATWVASCVGVPTVHDFPSEYLVDFNTPTYFPYINDKTVTPHRGFNQQEQEVIAFSKNIYTQRVNLSSSLSDTSAAYR